MSQERLPNRRIRRAITRWFARHKEMWRNGILVVLVAAIPVQGALLWRQALPQVTLSLPQWMTASNQTETDAAAGAMPIRFASRSKNGVYGVEYNTDSVKQRMSRRRMSGCRRCLTRQNRARQPWRPIVRHSSSRCS